MLEVYLVHAQEHIPKPCTDEYIEGVKQVGLAGRTSYKSCSTKQLLPVSLHRNCSSTVAVYQCGVSDLSVVAPAVAGNKGGLGEGKGVPGGAGICA